MKLREAWFHRLLSIVLLLEAKLSPKGIGF